MLRQYRDGRHRSIYATPNISLEYYRVIPRLFLYHLEELEVSYVLAVDSQGVPVDLTY